MTLLLDPNWFTCGDNQRATPNLQKTGDFGQLNLPKAIYRQIRTPILFETTTAADCPRALPLISPEDNN